MKFLRLLVPAALILTVAGMMLVIGGVIVAGVFLPGVVLIGIGLIGWAAAAALHAATGDGAYDARSTGAAPR
jgi:hypothetical protein